MNFIDIVAQIIVYYEPARNNGHYTHTCMYGVIRRTVGRPQESQGLTHALNSKRLELGCLGKLLNHERSSVSSAQQ
jgi:hypothetical protein